jgi:hypothetical protein
MKNLATLVMSSIAGPNWYDLNFLKSKWEYLGLRTHCQVVIIEGSFIYHQHIGSILIGRPGINVGHLAWTKG